MTLKETMSMMQAKLEKIYPANEARWIVREIFFNLKGYRLADLMLKADDEVSDYISGKIDKIMSRLLANEPIQYILGTTRFYGMDFKVTPDTLIPRPETEEMVDIIVKRWGSADDLRVLDICTGSGCIAIALARNLPFSRVTGIDISEVALKVARENANDLKANVMFVKEDALTLVKPRENEYDLIVSNPPYVLESEKKEMDKNVLEYEPDIALFVPDNDPLRFYKPIIEYSACALRSGGMLYMEINPLEVNELLKLVDNGVWSDCEIMRDLSGRYRFMILTRSKG